MSVFGILNIPWEFDHNSCGNGGLSVDLYIKGHFGCENPTTVSDMLYDVFY